MSVLLLEDALVAQLFPITTARPACSITVGSYTLLDLVRVLDQPVAAWVRPYLRTIMELDQPDVWQLEGDADGFQAGPTLILNARLIPNVTTLNALRQILSQNSNGAAGIVWDGDQVAAIVNPGWTWRWIVEQASSSAETLLLAAHNFNKLTAPLKLMTFPHETIAANMRFIGENLQFRLESGKYQQQADGVFMASGAKLGQYVITDTSSGPIVIDQNANVGPYTLLKGPIYIGAGAKILEHAAIKDQVSLGHTTKIGGEVEAAVVEPYSNKQHHGFLGHSYLGSWINLGAGTCNSDLKNTYGTVNMEYPNGKSATGMQFLGCVMGDYAKTAINTGIFTGKVIGVCSMMYGFVTSNVPSFVNYARLFGQMTTLPPEVMIATQQRMFSRRKVQQRPCDMQLMHDMYRITQNERDKFGDALAF
jgi:UDP-N-acetylglucosamine diphosphorylase / glucose-1-phosphate thymidylyltransferase / UDP-N-acetylgalactosamine diphosphorylase / glucosamine-1-phosphate N-acetyltransferase / galactosamine-1-phosphate N-acetyltransferase